MREKFLQRSTVAGGKHLHAGSADEGLCLGLTTRPCRTRCHHLRHRTRAAGRLLAFKLEFLLKLAFPLTQCLSDPSPDQATGRPRDRSAHNGRGDSRHSSEDWGHPSEKATKPPDEFLAFHLLLELFLHLLFELTCPEHASQAAGDSAK
jgi:hypothetical protein